MGRCLGLGCAVDEVVGDCGGRGVEVGTDGGGGLGGLGGPREHARLTASEAGWLVVLKGIVRMAVPVVVPLATPRPHKDAHVRFPRLLGDRRSWLDGREGSLCGSTEE